ncbi:MAG: bifunctional glutamate N-acetyltransferase/amino-acid acetyltransferase ArgJ [Gammaproteobacteria bacterium]|nr:bifunctional glutamate N-acetyltransferase/amino-acid acetyltransferase ArgJ [Gammaproteobacteria bacterium]
MSTDEAPFSAVTGVRLSAVAAGIKYADRHDLVLMELVEGARCAAVFTRNAFCAAPVLVARQHLEKESPRYLLINSGNANAGTGERGLASANDSCASVAEAAGCASHRVLPFSTGVIGEPLPIDRVTDAVSGLFAGLGEQAWPEAARAIMTTDTVPKLVSRRVALGRGAVTVTGMAKGAGMIRPDMATMLAFLATDATVDQTLLQQCLEQAVAPSFNSISVDGDTSTNDACVLVATGAAGGDPVVHPDSDAYRALSAAVTEVCMELARAIVRDGEGATRLVEVVVEGAGNGEEARQVAYTIAHSPLVKTAMFAADPNWGRILAAVGRAGVEKLDIGGVSIWLDDTCIVRDGEPARDYTEEAGRQVMEQDAYKVRVGLGRGEQAATVLTCDLSYDYVRINAEYRS